jgi:hypothetical protein
VRLGRKADHGDAPTARQDVAQAVVARHRAVMTMAAAQTVAVTVKVATI